MDRSILVTNLKDNDNILSFVDTFGLSVDDRWKTDNTNDSIYTNCCKKTAAVFFICQETYFKKRLKY